MTDLAQFRWQGVAFIVATGSFLLMLLVGTARLFPAPRHTGFSGAGLRGSQGGTLSELYRQSRRHWRAIRDRGGPEAGTRFVPIRAADGTEDSQPAMGIDAEAVPLRVVSLAQSLLCHRHGGDSSDAWVALRATRAEGDFRGFEEKRFAVHLANLEIRRAVRRDYAAAAVANAADERATFIDYTDAAIATLLTGDAEGAVRWAERALGDWPNQGNGYGDAYLLLMLAHAAHGDTEPVLTMLDDFQRVYPDWLYGERYLPDVAAVERRYPRAPLLKVIRGYQLALLADPGGASGALRQALAAGNLAREARPRVARWLRQAMEERPR